MGCDPNTGYIRELQEENEAKPNEVVFKRGELISIKGCLFMVQQICGAPHNTITLKGTGIKQQEANMI